MSLEESLQKIMKARTAILANGATPSSQGTIDCPVCNKGKLNYTMASNKHVHAKCTTPGCVTWME